jgi:hypothetical protein
MTPGERKPGRCPADCTSASSRARAAGRPVPDLPEISPAEAFSRAADAFYGMLCVLADEDGGRPVLFRLAPGLLRRRLQGLIAADLGRLKDLVEAEIPQS